MYILICHFINSKYQRVSLTPVISFNGLALWILEICVLRSFKSEDWIHCPAENFFFHWVVHIVVNIATWGWEKIRECMQKYA